MDILDYEEENQVNKIRQGLIQGEGGGANYSLFTPFLDHYSR